MAGSPAYGDFLLIIGVCLLFLGLLKVLLNMARKWQEMMLKRVKDAMAKRRNVSDNFRAENGFSWDYVMVFKVYDADDELTPDQQKNSLKSILADLASGGLETRLFYSVQADEVYCKIRCPLDRLMKEADRINMKLRLNSDNLRAACKQGRKDKWDPVDIPDISEESTLDPYEYIHAKYEYKRQDVCALYKVWPNGTIFRGSDRLKLIQSILMARRYEGGCHLDVYKLIKTKCMIGYFPLHDYVELRTLEEKWLRFWQLPWNQPMDEIKDYFGEKIALYFLFLGHYTTWLMSAGVAGFFAWINVAADGNDPNAVIMPYFACFIAIWAVLFLEFWKRKEKTHAMMWGTVGYEEEEITRPQFEGVRQPNPVNGREHLYFPQRTKNIRIFKSSSIILGFIMVVIVVVASIFVLKLVLSKVKGLVVGGIQLAGIICSLCNAVQIQVMNMIYGEVAIKLNNFENHRTDTQYEDNLIAKTFVFQFVNSFSALIYVAFFKPFIQDIDPCINSCMKELQTTLGTIFLTRLIVGNLTEVGVPYFFAGRREKSETKGSARPLSEIEKNFIQDEYHVMLGPFGDYSEAAIQYGYATMFVAAFPLAALISFCRRPEPRSAEDIGTWQSILEIISLAAVVTNSALVAYTGTYAINQRWVVKAFIFVSMATAILSVQAICAIVIPDEPEEVTIQLQRQDYICGKILDDIQDEDDSDLVKDVSSKLDYTIRITDDDPL